MGYKTKCKDCKKHKLVSARELCLNCAMVRVKKASQELKDHKGPAWNKWKRGYRKFLAKQEIEEAVKICPKCYAEQKKTAKRCNICKFVFKDYSQTSKTA